MTMVDLLKGVSAAAVLGGLSLGTAAPAIAQDADAANDDREVIVVTARKREETLLETPVAVTAFAGDTLLENDITSIADLSLYTTGFQLQSEFGRQGDRPVIRGQANILGESGVAYFIDGAYISGSLLSFDIGDIERIEVIKGPQSALYGRNTYSGAVAITTRRPTDGTETRIDATYGEDGEQEINASLRGNIVPGELWGSVQARYYDFDGPFTNAFNGDSIGAEKTTSLSGRLIWEPIDILSVDFRAAVQSDDDGPNANFHQDASVNNCFTDNGSLYAGLGRYYCGTIAPRQVNQNYDEQFVRTPGFERDQQQYVLRADLELPSDLTLTSITGHTFTNERFAADADYQPTAFQTSLFTPGGFPIPFFPGQTPPFGYGFATGSVDFSFESEDLTSDLSQEFRLANGVDTRLHWEVGGFYYFSWNKGRDVREIPAGGQAIADANFAARVGEVNATCAANPICSFVLFPSGTSAPPLSGGDGLFTRTTVDNRAIFGLVEYDINDQLSITAEARYAEEEIGVTSEITGADETATFDFFAPRVTVDYQATPNTLIYGSFAMGNKPGGFNTATFDDLQDAETQLANGTPAEQAAAEAFLAFAGNLRTFDEEEVTAFEIGTKNSLFDGDLSLIAAAFFNQVDGYQLTSAIANLAGSTTISVNDNVGDAEILGLELEAFWTPSSLDGLSVNFGYAYTDSEFTSGADQNQGVLNDAADDGLINCSTGDEFPNAAGCQSIFGSIVGKRIPRSSEHQLTLGGVYRQPFATGWEWYAGGNVAYESERFVQVHNEADTGAATVLNLNFGIENETYAIRIWGKNVTDEDAVLAAVRYADGADSFKRSFFGSLRPPARWGVTATARF